MYSLEMIWKNYGILDYEKWHKHQPKPITESKEAYILWEDEILTDRETTSKRPDTVAKDFKRKTCLLIDILIPTDNNISVKEYNKINKSKELEIEIVKMWHVKTTTETFGSFDYRQEAVDMIKKETDKHIDKIDVSPKL